MKSKYIGLICGILGLVVVLYPNPKITPPDGTPKPVVSDVVSKSFDIYETLWRKHNIDAADKIKAGELKTEQEVWDFLAAGQAPARKVAFDELAKAEQDYFDKHGGWSLKNHEDLLRSYKK